MRRIVVTGIGIVSPVGNNKETTWKNLLDGVSGIGRITAFDPEKYTAQIAGEVKDFNPEDYGIEAKEAKRLDRFSHFALAAAKEAVEDAGINFSGMDTSRCAVSIGVGFGGIKTVEAEHEKILSSGPRRVSPFTIPMMIGNMASGNVSIAHDIKGPQFCPVAACATGTFGIIEGFRAIREGVVDTALTGGVEAAISPLSIGGFAAARALSTRNDDPQKASRPFDRDRDGFVTAEGGAILVLEELEQAKARGARIYAEVIGYGSSSDSHHITQPHPEADGAYRAMKMALDIAGIQPEEVDYINAHGTSTPFNDKLETYAIKRLFGDHAKKIKINSTKSMTGHLLGAAGALEGAVMALSLYHQKLHPTINLENPDPDCDLDYTPNTSVNHPMRYAISNSFGFGGVNGVIVFKKFEG